MITLDLLDEIHNKIPTMLAGYVLRMNLGYNRAAKKAPNNRWMIEIRSDDNTEYSIKYYYPIDVIQIIKTKGIIDRNQLNGIDGTIIETICNSTQYDVLHKSPKHKEKIKEILYLLEDITHDNIDPELWDALDEN